MAKTVDDKKAETERKLEMAQIFLEQACRSHLRNGTWGNISVELKVEAGGYIKESKLSDVTTVRDLPSEKIQLHYAPPLTKDEALS